MKRKLCLALALLLSMTALSCDQVRGRQRIQDATDAYNRERYEEAATLYREALDLGMTFPELYRSIGYSYIGMYKPGIDEGENARYADLAIQNLQRYLQLRPDDTAAEGALVNLFLNANRTSQAIQYFEAQLAENPDNVSMARSIANLYAKQGNFPKTIEWYERITRMEQDDPESFYTYGVVLYEKVAKDPPAELEERLELIESGKRALSRALELNREYFEALVYMNLLFREQSRLAQTPEEQQELLARADEYRNEAVAIAKKRAREKEAAESGDPEPGAGGTVPITED
jgi:tetratricopeptide (TPR) repeat protein